MVNARTTRTVPAACAALAFLIALAPAALAQAAPAQATSFAVDPNHSTVGFSIRHLVTNVKGSFNSLKGTIDYDAANPAASKVEIVVEAKSIDTGNQKRDDHLRSPDFFEVAKFPELTFRSEKVAAKSKDLLEVTGKLTMHGVTKTVTVPVKVLGVMDTKEFGKKAGFEAEFTVNRKDFGITWNKALDQGGFVLGDDVTVTISLEANGMAKAQDTKS